MKMKLKRCGLMIMSIVISCSLLFVSGCGKKQAENKYNSDYPTGEINYPIETDVTLSYWMILPPALSTTVSNFEETPFAKKSMENTGISIKYTHPAQGGATEALNLLIASGELPDIIETDVMKLNPTSAIERNVIIELNDIIDKYCPNLKKYLSENPDIDSAIKTDDGKYYCFPFIRTEPELLSVSGIMLRKDWLDDLGLSVPETMDEWEIVLDAFKKNKCEYPLAFNMDGLEYFSSAYGIKADFYINNDDKICFGAQEEGYKELLTRLNSWYKKGYIDPSFALFDSSIVKTSMLNGTCGVCFGTGGSGMGQYLSANPDTSKYNLAAAPYPVLNKGDKSEIGNKSLTFPSVTSVCITAQCKDPVMAARYLDYGYSEEGHMLYNFGIEGESYKMEGGYPKYTDNIVKNSEGKSMSQMMGMYMRSWDGGPFVQDVRYIEQYYGLPQQQEALKVWSNNNDEKHQLPQITLTKDESNELNQIMSEVRTYRSEERIKFVNGTRSLDELDSFAKEFKKLNIDRAIEIQEDGYARYKNR